MLKASGGALFGRCPRISCCGHKLLPIGLSDEYGVAKIHRYCCCCGETFREWSSTTDGCAWGTSFAHLLLLTYGKEMLEYLKGAESEGKYEIEVKPQIFGFEIHPDATINYPLSKKTGWK